MLSYLTEVCTYMYPPKQDTILHVQRQYVAVNLESRLGLYSWCTAWPPACSHPPVRQRLTLGNSYRQHSKYGNSKSTFTLYKKRGNKNRCFFWQSVWRPLLLGGWVGKWSCCVDTSSLPRKVRRQYTKKMRQHYTAKITRTLSTYAVDPKTFDPTVTSTFL